ncbi:MAG: cation diffusion facilitator family transporter, partial [Bacteroidota bacterium]
ISLVVGIGMFTAKISAYFLTGSSAIFSDAAESVVHVAATSMALFSIYLSAKPADKSHLYGHGNIEYFSAGMEGLLIVIAAITIVYFSVEDMIKGVTTKSLDVGTLIIATAGVINLFLGFFLVRKGKETNSLTLTADGKHVLTDSYTSIGVVIGLVLVLTTGFVIIDPLIAIAVALNILYTGSKLIRESIGGLMNETDTEILHRIVAALQSMKKEFWIDIHHLRFWKSGERVFVDFHLILPYYFSIKQSHLEEEAVEKKLLEIFPASGVKIHMDYCKENVCKYCDLQNCDERQEPKSIQFNWDTEKFLGEPIYQAEIIS